MFGYSPRFLVPCHEHVSEATLCTYVPAFREAPVERGHKFRVIGDELPLYGQVLVACPLRDECPLQTTPTELVVGIDGQRGARCGHGFVEASLVHEDTRVHRVERALNGSSLIASWLCWIASFARPSLTARKVSVVRVGIGVVWVELESSFPLRLGAGPVPVAPCHDRSQRFMSFRRIFIKSNGLEALPLWPSGLASRTVGVSLPLLWANQPDPSQTLVGRGIGRIFFKRQLKEMLGGVEIGRLQRLPE